ncbi:MAG: hypothetical protein L3J69_07200 [Desulfobacula sp.]|nr:hypothetical protein [Desulfobacula sp.]MCF6247132.1 hypothetical protein [Desulfobacula sp.]
MNISDLLFFLGFVLVIMHGISIHKLGVYLENHHADKWKEITPKSFLGLPQKYLKSRNYFTELGFVFSSDDLSDQKVKNYKKNTKLFLFFAAISWVLMILFVFVS